MNLEELIQAVFLFFSLSGLTITSVLRLLDLSGKGTWLNVLGHILVIGGTCLGALEILAYGWPDKWAITCGFMGGLLLVLTRNQKTKKKGTKYLTWLIGSLLAVSLLTSVQFSRNVTLGVEPSFKVHQITIEDGYVGQVNYVFRIKGQRLKNCGSDYRYTIRDVSRNVFVKTNILRGRQTVAGPPVDVVVEQPIGPFENPGNYEYRYFPIDNCDGVIHEFGQGKPVQFLVKERND